MPSSSLSPQSPSIANEIQTQQSKDLEAQLDSHILHVRKEIAKLRAHKQRLSSSLLCSSRVQKQLFTRRPNKQNGATTESDSSLGAKLAELESKVDQEKEINDIKIHRLAFGVTSFPFSDDAPERRGPDGQNQTMLGLRFDLHPTREELQTGRGDVISEDVEQDERISNYFIILRKLTLENQLYLRVHQHSIPAHIDVDGLEQKHLPLPDALHFNCDQHSHDDSGVDLTLDVVQPDTNSPPALPQVASTEDTGQDLHAFTRTLHAHLRAWHYRIQSVYLLRKEVEQRPELGLQDVKCTNDGRQVTIVWKSDDLAILKVGFDGVVETVVAYGSAEQLEDDGGEEKNESVRLFTVERKLSRTEKGGRVRISNLVERLEIVR